MYTIMHRTQILLEPWQHQALKSMAASRGRSISALIREILTEHLGGKPYPEGERFDDIEGIAEGPADLAENHDGYLYDRRRGR
jgi:hypothetical protein